MKKNELNGTHTLDRGGFSTEQGETLKEARTRVLAIISKEGIAKNDRVMVFLKDNSQRMGSYLGEARKGTGITLAPDTFLEFLSISYLKHTIA